MTHLKIMTNYNGLAMSIENLFLFVILIVFFAVVTSQYKTGKRWIPTNHPN